MTDRHAAYFVVLASDMREDDAEESVLTALRMVKGVASVRPVPSSVEVAIAATRRDIEWRSELLALMERMSSP